MSGPSGYSRLVSTDTWTPGSSSTDSETMRAIFSGTSCATRTGSKREPGAESRVVRISDGSHAHERPEPLRDVLAAAERQVGGDDLDRPRRDVVDQHATLAIEDQATRGRDRLLDRPVRLRAGRVGLAAIDLEVGEPGSEDAEHQHHDDAEGQEADGAAVAFAVRGEQVLVHQATRSTSRRRAAIATASGPTTAARTTSYTVDGRIDATAADESGAVVNAVLVRMISME